MSRVFVLALTAGILIVAGMFTWLVAAEHHAPAPAGRYEPHLLTPWPVTPERAEQIRDDAFSRAAVRLDPSSGYESSPFEAELVSCRFLRTSPSGTTAKFTCVLDGGDVVKVKYGRNAEIHAEALASRLLAALGYATDRVSIVRRVRCYGCPRYPFLAEQVLSLTPAPDVLERSHDEGYTDFEWASVERKFGAPPIETPAREGWAWWELKNSEAPRADLDAFRLLAVFLAHWDNKASNQRLLCLDDVPASPDGRCEHPLLMLHDLGATFGPHKLDLARWRDRPVWRDRQACLVSMRDLPYEGATFPDAKISEEGRAQLARQLSTLSPGTIRQWIEEARLPAFYSATDDDRDIDAWTDAFRHRIAQITNAGPCSPPSPKPLSPTSSPGSPPSHPSRGSSS